MVPVISPKAVIDPGRSSVRPGSWFPRYLRYNPARKRPKTAGPQVSDRPVFVVDLAHQTQHCRDETKAVVWPFNGKTARNSCPLSACDHEGRIGRNAKKGTMITARIKSANVKIPMIVGEDQQIGLRHLALALAKPSD